MSTFFYKNKVHHHEVQSEYLVYNALKSFYYFLKFHFSLAHYSQNYAHSSYYSPKCISDIHPRKSGLSNQMSILTGTDKLQFSCVCSFVKPYPNVAVGLASIQGRQHFKFQWNPCRGSQDTSEQIYIKTLFSFSFSKLCKNCYNSCMRASIWLKFGTHIRGPKANTSITFGVNLINIQGFISNLRIK